MKSHLPERTLYTQQSSEKYTDSTLSPINQPEYTKKLSRLMEGTVNIKNKRLVQENKRNRIKLAVQMHQELYSILDNAAITIQKHARRYITRKAFVQRLIQKYENENYLLQVEHEITEFWEKDSKIQHMAAFRIQRYWKGFRKYPPKTELIKRIAKMILVTKAVTTLLERKRKRKLAMDYICRIYEERILRLYWKEFANYDPIAEPVESNDKEEIDDSEIFEKTEEMSQINLNLSKENEELTETGSALSRLPTGIRPKVFILSEMNYIKPTLSSTYKNSNNNPEPRPISVPKTTKGSRKRATINRRLLKQKKSRVSDLSDSSQGTSKIREKAKIRVSSEAKLENDPIMPKKYDKIESKVKQFRIKTAVRSSSYMPVRNLLEEKEKDEIINTYNKKVLLPTLDFKQALPELYGFVESYRPFQKKTEPIVNSSGLILMPSLKIMIQK